MLTDEKLREIRARADLACDDDAPALVHDVRALLDDLEALRATLPCGHRKVDWDDSYGGCVACGLKQTHDYHEVYCNDRDDALEAAGITRPEKLENLLKRYREMLDALSHLEEGALGYTESESGAQPFPIRDALQAVAKDALNACTGEGG